MMALRLFFSLLGVVLGVAPTLAQTADVIREHFGRPDPVYEFEKGVSNRQDAQKSRSDFRSAAAYFDHDWASEDYKSQALAINRGRAHYLAGNLPQAVRAFHDGLRLAP